MPHFMLEFALNKLAAQEWPRVIKISLREIKKRSSPPFPHRLTSMSEK